MSDLTLFHFLRPLWLLALLPAGWLLWHLGRGGRQQQFWQQLCDAHLLPQLWLEQPGRPSKLPLALLGGGWLLAIVALAGPSWEQSPEISYKTHPARVLVLDLSAAMNATDLPPSRLAQARFKLHDLLEASREGETALLVFAGEPHLVTPLTSDVETIAAMLPALSPAIMPVPGDKATPALQMAGALLEQAGFQRGEIVLLSEGVGDQASALTAIAELAERGYRVSVLGIGTPAGAPIPHADGTFGRISRLDETALRELARQGNGRYRRIRADSEDITALAGGHDQLRNSGTKTLSHSLQHWVEHGVWLLPPLLLLAAIGYRRGWLGLLLPLMLLPQPGDAAQWLDLWLTPDQQGQRLIERGEPEKAAQRFENPHWQAAALYAAGDFDGAARRWAELPGAEARYNQGNALARAGRFRDAITAYAEALALDPTHADAAANKALLERLLRKQAEQENRAAQASSDGDPASDAGSQQASTAGEGTARRPGEGDDGDVSTTPSEQTGTDNPSQSATATAMQQGRLPGSRYEPPRYDDDIALEQWLRQIPDDPAALLQRKFLLEHLMRRERR